jgi:olefin beta-lactone synthetase
MSGAFGAVVAAERLPTGLFQQSITNVADLVLHCAAMQPDVRALVDKRTGKSVTFGALGRDIEELAAAIAAAGLEPGDRCVLFIAEGPSFITHVFACFAAGVIPVLIDPGIGVDNMLACIAEQRPRGLLGIAKAHVLKAVKRDAFSSIEVSLLPDGFFPGARALSKLRAPGKALVSQHRTRAGSVAAILYTSGSTGAPKGVLYTHAMIAAQVRAIRDMFDMRPGDVMAATFLGFALYTVGMGMTTVFPDMDFRSPAKADPKKILAAFEGADTAFGSPSLLAPFARFLDSNSIQLKGMRRLLTAGAPVSPALFEQLVRHLPDGDAYTPYGATEALPVSFMGGRAVVQETAKLTREGWGTCVGSLAPGAEVKIIAITDAPIRSIADARELPTGEIGEIIVRGAQVTMSYDMVSERGRKANELSKIGDGTTVWHRMGDAGHLDEQGRLWFCGRKAHRVEKGGHVLHSIPVEGVVETLWPERAALVGPVVQGATEPQVVVWLERTREDSKKLGSEAELLAKVRALPGCEVVERVLFHDAKFPVDRRHNAKIEREALRALAAQRLAGARA